MTPAARVAAAIEILDTVLGGEAAEKTLTTWARRNRFAGSGDRRAIRDLVFDAIRQKRSYALLGGAETGRGLMIGALRNRGEAPESFFTGEGHAPPVLGPGEVPDTSLRDAPDAVRLNIPDWLEPEYRESLASDFEPILEAMNQRAPIYLRVNSAVTDVAKAASALREDGTETIRHPAADTALEVVGNAHRVHLSAAYKSGLVELQDVSSQAVVGHLPDTTRVLDFCAGGGGKSLALAARGMAHVVAHDINPARMADLPERAKRAGANIQQVSTQDLGSEPPFDLVLCDAPCSGSGAWRRSAEGKWRLTPDRLKSLTQTQLEILNKASNYVAENGVLAYATCSFFRTENEDVTDRFVAAQRDWAVVNTYRFDPLRHGDGFFLAIFRRTR